MSIQPTFSRESDDYTATRHAMQRIKDTDRHVSAEMVNQTVETGEVHDAWRDDRGDIKVELYERINGIPVAVVIVASKELVVTATHRGAD